MAKRKKYTPEFKFKIALEAIKEGSITETSRRYGIAAGLLTKWRDVLLSQGHNAFGKTPDKERKELKGKIAKLEQMIDKREVELNLLKNFSDFYELENGP